MTRGTVENEQKLLILIGLTRSYSTCHDAVYSVNIVHVTTMSCYYYVTFDAVRVTNTKEQGAQARLELLRFYWYYYYHYYQTIPTATDHGTHFLARAIFWT